MACVNDKNILQLYSPNCMCVWPCALDDFPTLQVRSAEGTRRIRVESRSRVITYQCRGGRFARPFPLDEAEAAVGGKKPRGSRERTPVDVKCEPKDNDGVAHHQYFPSDSAISIEGRLAQPRFRASKS